MGRIVLPPSASHRTTAKKATPKRPTPSSNRDMVSFSASVGAVGSSEAVAMRLVPDRPAFRHAALRAIVMAARRRLKSSNTPLGNAARAATAFSHRRRVPGSGANHHAPTREHADRASNLTAAGKPRRMVRLVGTGRTPGKAACSRGVDERCRCGNPRRPAGRRNHRPHARFLIHRLGHSVEPATVLPEGRTDPRDRNWG